MGYERETYALNLNLKVWSAFVRKCSCTLKSGILIPPTAYCGVPWNAQSRKPKVIRQHCNEWPHKHSICVLSKPCLEKRWL